MVDVGRRTEREGEKRFNVPRSCEKIKHAPGHNERAVNGKASEVRRSEQCCLIEPIRSLTPRANPTTDTPEVAVREIPESYIVSHVVAED